ncbi:MAG: hypothetical protein Q8O83_02180 [bacterium]|nr:hypothetical protein [bacterium]
MSYEELNNLTQAIEHIRKEEINIMDDVTLTYSDGETLKVRYYGLLNDVYGNYSAVIQYLPALKNHTLDCVHYSRLINKSSR